MTTNNIEIEKIVMWSLLSDKPVMLYREEYDDTLVAWNGILLTKVVAMNLAIENYDKWPSLKMKQDMFNTYRQLYITGFFGEQQWGDIFDNTANNFFHYLRNITKKHTKETMKDIKITEVLSWFI